MKSKQQFLAALSKINADCGTKKYRKQLEGYIVERHNYQTPPFTCVALTIEIGGESSTRTAIHARIPSMTGNRLRV